MRLQLFTISIVLLLSSCRQQQTSTLLTDSEKKVIADSIRQILNNYYEDIRKSGLSAEFKYLDNSPEFSWVPPGYTNAISYDSVATILNQNASKYSSIDNSFDTLRIIPLSKELATYSGRLHSTMTDSSGKVVDISLVETGVLVRRQDGWKLLHGQTSVLNNE